MEKVGRTQKRPTKRRKGESFGFFKGRRVLLNRKRRREDRGQQDGHGRKKRRNVWGRMLRNYRLRQEKLLLPKKKSNKRRCPLACVDYSTRMGGRSVGYLRGGHQLVAY